MLKLNKFKVIEIIPTTIWLLADVKNYLRISHDYDDQLISSLIDSAIFAAENFIGLSLVSRRIEFTGKIWQRKKLTLKYKPMVNLVRAIIRNGEEEIEIGADNYDIDNNGWTMLFELKQPQSFVLIEYIAGFLENSIPSAIKHGILLHIAEMYDRSEITSSPFSKEIQNLYLPYRQIRL